MSKLILDFINWVHLKCFNVFNVVVVVFFCFFFIIFYQFDGFADVVINGHLEGENAITWSKSDINEFSTGENNDKICNFDEYDIFTVQHWDLVWFIPLWNAKSIYLFRKLLPLNSIKLNLNLVTKLKLFSTVNIKNIDFNLIFSLKATSWKFELLLSYIRYIIKGSPIKSCIWLLSFVSS